MFGLCLYTCLLH